MSEKPEITLDNLQKPWTRKQYMFAMGIVGGLQGAEAARQAGFSEKTSASQAHRMLTNVDFKHIQDFIKSKHAKTVEKHEITIEKITAEIARAGFGDEEIVQWKDKLKALDMLAKMRGGYELDNVMKVIHEGGDNPVEFKTMSMEEAAKAYQQSLKDI